MKWKQDNIIKIENDDNYYDNVYTVNLNRVLGGNPNGGSSKLTSQQRTEKNNKQIQSNLYHYLKQDIKNIVQYEFTF